MLISLAISIFFYNMISELNISNYETLIQTGKKNGTFRMKSCKLIDALKVLVQ
jgi:hypothetical protein